MSKIKETLKRWFNVTAWPRWLQITGITVGIVGVVSLLSWGISAMAKAEKLNQQLKCTHVYEEGVITQEATCDVDGVLKYTCKKCDKVKTEEIPMLGHKTKIVEGYASSCQADGKTDGTVCTVCNKVVTEQKSIPKLGHNVVIDTGRMATCLDAGLTEGQHCKRCDEVIIKQSTIPALGHNIITVYGYAATCTSTGLTDGTKCANCETVYSAQVTIDALGHKPVTHAGKAATCLEKGWNSYVTCERASCSYTTYKEISALGHSFSNAICLRCSYQLPEGHECIYTLEEVTQATCETDGLKVKKCLCGEVETETIKAYGHAWNSGIVTQAPACGVDGVRTYTCANCGSTKTETIKAIDHEFTETRMQELTCTTDGIVRYDCVNCDYTYTNTTEANGHDNDAGVITIAATCTNVGERVYACKICGAITTERIGKLSHTVKTRPYVAPTCTTTGKSVGSYCSVCGGTLTEQTDIPALGHSFGEWLEVSKLSCTTDGVEKRTCTVCNKTETSKVTAIGHDYTNGTCLNCGHTLVTSGLAMKGTPTLNVSATRPKLDFEFTVEQSVINGLEENEEIGAIIVDMDSFWSVSSSQYTDWVEALNENEKSYVYKKASIAGTTGTVTTATIPYASMNTSYGAIPCVKTVLDNGEISYQYASNVFGKFTQYAKSVSYVVGTMLSNETLKEGMGEGTMTNEEKTRLLLYLDESVDLANGLSAPEYNGSEPTLVMKLNGVAQTTKKITVSTSRSKTLTLKSEEGVVFQIAGKYDTSMLSITSNGVDTLEIKGLKTGTTNLVIGFANEPVLITVTVE